LVGATQPFKTVGEWLNNIAENAKQGAVFAGATSLVGPLADFGIQGAKSKYNAIPNKEAGFIKIKGNPAESPTTPPASVGESRGVPSTGGEIVPSAQKNPLDSIMERYGKVKQAEASGEQMLNSMAQRKISPQETAMKFWNETFPQIPEASKGKIIKELEAHTGMKLGYNGTTLQDMIKSIDLGNDVNNLQGTERGFATLMQYANDQVKPKLQSPAISSGGEIGEAENQ